MSEAGWKSNDTLEDFLLSVMEGIEDAEGTETLMLAHEVDDEGCREDRGEEEC